MSRQNRDQGPPQAGTYQNPEGAMLAPIPDGAADRKIDAEIWTVLTTSVFVGANPSSILAAWDYCAARGLDILKKPCHIVPMKVGDVWRDVIMPGIYELRTTAMRTGEYVGTSDPEWGPMVDIPGMDGQAPEWCRVVVYRLQHGEPRAYPHTAYFEEECARKAPNRNERETVGRVNSMWTKRKRGQLQKCAEAGALRKGFPEELGGEMTADEMHSKGVTVDNDTGRVVDPAPPPESMEESDAVVLATGPEGEEYTGPQIKKLAAKAGNEEELSFLSSLINQIADPREKLAAGRELRKAADRVREWPE